MINAKNYCEKDIKSKFQTLYEEFDDLSVPLTCFLFDDEAMKKNLKTLEHLTLKPYEQLKFQIYLEEISQKLTISLQIVSQKQKVVSFQGIGFQGVGSEVFCKIFVKKK